MFKKIIANSFLALTLSLALVGAGCNYSASTASAQDQLLQQLPQLGAANKQLPGTYVAKVTNSNFYVAVVINGQTAIGYACDNTNQSTWLSGTFNNGQINLTDNLGGKITGDLANDQLTGQLTLASKPDHQLAFTAVAPTGVAGLYRKTETNNDLAYVSGWIYLADGTAKGTTQRSFVAITTSPTSIARSTAPTTTATTSTSTTTAVSSGTGSNPAPAGTNLHAQVSVINDGTPAGTLTAHDLFLPLTVSDSCAPIGLPAPAVSGHYTVHPDTAGAININFPAGKTCDFELSLPGNLSDEIFTDVNHPGQYLKNYKLNGQDVGFNTANFGRCQGTITGDATSNCDIILDQLSGNSSLQVFTQVINDGPTNIGAKRLADFNYKLKINGITSGVPVTDNGVITTKPTGTTVVVVPKADPNYTVSLSPSCSLPINENFQNVCMITYNDNYQAAIGSIIVTNHVINNGAGTLAAGNFGMRVEVGNSASETIFPGNENGTVVTVSPGSPYKFNEIPVPGYTTTVSTGCTGSVAPGAVANCTFTNTFNAVQ